MSDFFFDSSALVKAYVAEAGTNWVRTILDDERHQIYISHLAEVEVIAALTRRFRNGDLTEQERDQAVQDARQDCATYLTVDVAHEIIEAAIRLALTHHLRAYDAVQLASALEVRHVLLENPDGPINFTVVSSDKELNAAAALEGIQIEDPNNY